MKLKELLEVCFDPVLLDIHDTKKNEVIEGLRKETALDIYGERTISFLYPENYTTIRVILKSNT